MRFITLKELEVDRGYIKTSQTKELDTFTKQHISEVVIFLIRRVLAADEMTCR